MIRLLIDAVKAAVIVADRVCLAVEKNVRPQVSPRLGVGAPSPRPNCAASAGTGGHLPCLHPEWN